jgi:hypothetical protein
LAAVGVASAATAGAYRAVQAAIDPLLDAPTARVITLILADLADGDDRDDHDDHDAMPEPGTLTDAEAVALAALTTSVFPPLLST